ncbi:unnamed protein product [Closterium sp. NIES-54]
MCPTHPGAAPSDSSNADARGTCAGGAGFGGAGAGGASFGGAGAGGPRAGGAGLGGVGGGGNGTGGACSGGAGVGGVCFKGAGAGDAGTAPSAMCGPFHLTSLHWRQTLGLPSSSPDPSLSPPAHGLTFPPSDSAPV